jgi:hypothetical protein
MEQQHAQVRANFISKLKKGSEARKKIAGFLFSNSKAAIS